MNPCDTVCIDVLTEWQLNFHSYEQCLVISKVFNLKCNFFSPRLELLISQCIWKMETAQKAVKGKHVHSCPAHLLMTCFQVCWVNLQAIKFFTKTLQGLFFIENKLLIFVSA